MHPNAQVSLASARRADAEGRLADWVTSFLASPDSDNEALAGALVFEGATYLGPVELELDRLTPMAGPDEHEVSMSVTNFARRDRSQRLLETLIDLLEETSDLMGSAVIELREMEGRSAAAMRSGSRRDRPT